MNQKQIDDTLFETLFRQAVIDDYYQEICAQLFQEKHEQVTSLTPEFDLRMKKLLAQEGKKDFIRITLSYSKKVAAAFVIVMAVLFGILLFHTEVRAAVTKAIVEWYEEFTSFTFHNEAFQLEKKVWRPDYLPAGYQEKTVEELGKLIHIEYKNEHGDKIRFSFRPADNAVNIAIDNENHRIEPYDISGNEAFIAYAEKEEFDNGIIWSSEGFTFSLWGKLPIEELVKTAESVCKK